MTVAEALRTGSARLAASGIDNPRLEARLLLAHAMGCDTAALLRDPAAPVDPARYVLLLDRRCAHEPLAYLTGRREFWSLDLAVSGATLIPRPDTETVVEAALRAWGTRAGPCRVLDLGTGTGCLLLALLHELPRAFGVGIDRAPAAARLAANNARRIGLADRAVFLCGDWTNALAARFDLVVSNPPYIASGEISSLMPEVANHEPRLALDGGADGLDAYRAILPALDAVMAPEATAVLEMGIDQHAVLTEMASDCGFTATLHADLAGTARAIVLRRGKR
ncbi:MAG: peptide chain release factor N(5)-glutamine methyltransferase [Acetobacteraceae bacterium]